MNTYTLTLLALAVAIIAQAAITALSLDSCFRKQRNNRERLAWLALAVGSTVLAMDHFRTLELAARTGIYDVQQALLACIAAFFITFGIYGLSRRS